MSEREKGEREFRSVTLDVFVLWGEAIVEFSQPKGREKKRIKDTIDF